MIFSLFRNVLSLITLTVYIFSFTVAGPGVYNAFFDACEKWFLCSDNDRPAFQQAELCRPRIVFRIFIAGVGYSRGCDTFLLVQLSR